MINMPKIEKAPIAHRSSISTASAAGGSTPNACRKRHERLMERMNAEQWDGVKLDVLAQAYMEVRREMWSLLAARVGEKWQLVETKVSFVV
jgi:hypothetical protein